MRQALCLKIRLLKPLIAPTCRHSLQNARAATTAQVAEKEALQAELTKTQAQLAAAEAGLVDAAGAQQEAVAGLYAELKVRKILTVTNVPCFSQQQQQGSACIAGDETCQGR